jgi:hypothetical protein
MSKAHHARCEHTLVGVCLEAVVREDELDLVAWSCWQSGCHYIMMDGAAAGSALARSVVD